MTQNTTQSRPSKVKRLMWVAENKFFSLLLFLSIFFSKNKKRTKSVVFDTVTYEKNLDKCHWLCWVSVSEWMVLDGAKLHTMVVEKWGFCLLTFYILLQWNAPKWVTLKALEIQQYCRMLFLFFLSSYPLEITYCC